MTLQPRNSQFERDVRASFGAQAFMQEIGAVLTRVTPGAVDIRLPYSERLGQQNGFLHAGVTTALCDSACGFAALSLMEADKNVLSVEFKVNLLAPAVGQAFLATAKVLRSGRTLMVCQGDVFADESHVATMLATMIAR